MTMEHRESTIVQADSALRLSRRRAVQGAVWSIPVISVATAAPAFAASGTTLSIAWNAASFRYNSNADAASGTPSAAANAAIRADITVAGGTLSSLQVAFASTGTVQYSNHTSIPSRSGTTWLAGQASVAADGWTASVSPGTTQLTAVTFSRGSTPAGTYQLKFVLSSVAAGDFPFSLTATSPDAATPPAVSITADASSPFITGTP